MRWSKKHIKILKIVFTFFLIFTLIYLKPWISPKAHALTVTDNSSTTFNTGTYTNSQYNSGRGGVDTPPTNKNATYESSLKNSGQFAKWDNLSWTQEQKYGAEMPSNGAADTGYTQNLSMANNQVYYKLNETATTSNADSSGNNLTMTQNGGISPASTTAAMFTRGLQSNTQWNQYKRLPFGVSSRNQTQYSISLWFNARTIQNNATRTIYEEAQGTSANARLSIRLVNRVLQFAGRPLDSNNTTTVWVSASQTITRNNWYHVVAVYDSTSSTNNMKLYVSGVENSGSFTVPTISNTQNATINPRFFQGVAATSNTNNNTKLVSKLDEFATFTRALSADEVKNIYRRGAWTVNLLARSCPTSPCTTETYVGPTGSAASPFINDGTNSTNTVALSTSFFPINQFFQYKITYAIRITGQAVDYPTGSTSAIINSVSVDEGPATPFPTLSFAVRNTADTANTNICVLGLAKTNSLSSCSYRLKVSTNAASGYTVYVKTSTGLSNGIHSMSNASVGSGGGGGTDISGANVGVEKYGVVVTPGTLTSASAVNTTSVFNAGANAVLFVYPTTPTAIIQATGTNSPSATDTTHTSLITHKLNISNTTPPGDYIQNVTYTVASVF
jgi:hypothetical protein